MKTTSILFVMFSLMSAEVFGQGYKLVWSDEFDSTALDQTKWSYETGGGGWGNNELEYYTNSTGNCNVQNGYLTITAQKQSLSGYNYTSARIKTQDKFFFEFGKVEARIKLPYGKGMWPAFWMLGENISSVGWPSCGENDILEMIGGSGTGSTGNAVSDSTVYGTLHWSQNGSEASSGGKYSLSSGKFADDFHLFGVIWTSKLVQFYVDNTVYYQVDITPTALNAFRNNFFIILNLAVGGTWPGNPDNSTVFPQTMQVDYVRLYQDTTNDPTASIISPSDNSTFGANSDITISTKCIGSKWNNQQGQLLSGCEEDRGNLCESLRNDMAECLSRQLQIDQCGVFKCRFFFGVRYRECYGQRECRNFSVWWYTSERSGHNRSRRLRSWRPGKCLFRYRHSERRRSVSPR